MIDHNSLDEIMRICQESRRRRKDDVKLQSLIKGTGKWACRRIEQKRRSREPMLASKVDQSIATSALSSTTGSNKVLLIWLVGAAFFMESLDTTVLNTAVPTVAAAL